MKKSELLSLEENLALIFRKDYSFKTEFVHDTLAKLRINYEDVLRTAQLSTISAMAAHYNWSITIGRSGSGLKIVFIPNK